MKAINNQQSCDMKTHVIETLSVPVFIVYVCVGGWGCLEQPSKPQKLYK